MIQFSTKGETLERLQGVIKSANVLPQVRLTFREWRIDSSKILKSILSKEWSKGELIVRSSALVEDQKDQSMAGNFLSVKNVVPNEDALEKVITSVFNSYNVIDDNNQVLVQPMAPNVKSSGVVFSKDPTTGSNYIVINYDEVSGETDTVTSGNSNELTTCYYYKKSSISPKSYEVQKIIELVFELETLFKLENLDIEFAFDADGVLFLLQVRPLVIKEKNKISCNIIVEEINNISNKIKLSNQSHPYLHGKKTVYGIMPDWNPAEIIGVRPKPLSLSLYKEIITDSIWAYQRDNYGYKRLRSFPLLINFGGLPYIDVRLSFNSFLPKTINDDLSERLVDYYIEQLKKIPSFHDKVEFEIIYSCYTFDLPERLKVLLDYGFSEDDLIVFKDSLKNLTNRIIHEENGLWKKDLDKVKLLEEKREIILKSNLDNVSKVYWLLEDCKRYGTLPFAGLARAGFIAVQILKSLVSKKILTDKEYDCFMASLDTVGSKMSSDFSRLSKDVFLNRYGHLRPGTYDILSSRYDETPDLYFDWKDSRRINDTQSEFSLSLSQLNRINELLKEHGIEHDIVSLFNFIKSAIEGREYSKFIFTKSLSDILLFIKELGKEYGFSPEDCAFLDIAAIKKTYDSSMNLKILFQESIERGKKNFEVTKSIILPPLIKHENDVWFFSLPNQEPNFITLKKAKGETATVNDKELADKIIFVSSADPGYDWIFSKGIAGFITMYGGVNSHMAIRAGEMGIPAVIGAGERLFNKWSSFNVIEIDGLNKKVMKIR